ncbi:hypothetical protein KEM52_001559 [Ascosphaera acerosa]|nr:hypothetical protein KEM52_001559 [Ascosphaera acerosa]
MAEYWKSAERYWCKHCKTYVRDTAFDRTQHEATGKHQSALKRFLRDIHREQGRGERAGDRAKSEIERLRGIVSGAGAPTHAKQAKPAGSAPAPTTAPTGANSAAVLKERKQQMAQLAELGVAIPDEFRKEMALVGDWTRVSEKEVGSAAAGTSSTSAAAAAARLSVGVRKRKSGAGADQDDDDEEEEGEEKNGQPVSTRKQAWGQRRRGLPLDDEDDLDSLLAQTSSLAKPKVESPDPDALLVKREEDEGVTIRQEVKEEEDAPASGATAVKQESTDEPDLYRIKEEQTDVKTEPGEPTALQSIPPADEPQPPTAGIVFKKRKTKKIRT